MRRSLYNARIIRLSTIISVIPTMMGVIGRKCIKGNKGLRWMSLVSAKTVGISRQGLQRFGGLNLGAQEGSIEARDTPDATLPG